MESLGKAHLREKKTSVWPAQMTHTVEDHLIALASSTPPKGHSHWTLKLLVNGLVQAQLLDNIPHQKMR